MLMPCRTSTRPCASVSQRPAWPAGSLGAAPAVAARTAVTARAKARARRMRMTLELRGVGGKAEQQASAELVDRGRDEHVLSCRVDVAQAALERRRLIQGRPATEAVGGGHHVG